MKRKFFITDFLGIVEAKDCTGIGLADTTEEHIGPIGLPLKQMQSIGVDGALVMCGEYNSSFTHLKKRHPLSASVQVCVPLPSQVWGVGVQEGARCGNLHSHPLLC